MGKLGSLAKRAAERLTGMTINQIGMRSYVVVDRDRQADGYFAHSLLIQSLLARHKIDLVLDVGANRGQFGQKLRTQYSGEIHSFAPVSEVAKSLRQVAADDPHWHVHPFALGSEETTKTIHVSGSSDLSSFHKPSDYSVSKYGDHARAAKEEVVTIRRLDRVLDEIAPKIAGRSIYLKMDTQGFDLEVFRGLGSWLDKIAVLQSEVSLVPLYEGMPHWTESISTFEKAGFAVAGLYTVTRDAYRVIEYDCVMVRV